MNARDNKKLGNTDYFLSMVHWFTRAKQYTSILITRWLPRALFTVIGITAVNLLWLIPAIQNIRASASTLALEVTDRLRSNIEFNLENALHQLNTLSDEIIAEPARTQIAVNRFLEHNPNFYNVAVVDRSGHALMRLEQKNAEVVGAVDDYSRYPFFYLALQDIPNFWSVQTSPEGKLYTTLAMPVKRSGSIISVVIANLDVSNLIQTHSTERLNAVAYVVDRNGFIILDSNPEKHTTVLNVQNREIVQKVLIDNREVNGLNAEDSYKNKDGVTMFAVGLPISLAGWGIFVEQPTSQAFEGQRAVIAFAIATWLLGMTIVFIIIRGNYRLGALNDRLNDLLKENYEVGKTLVRRDIELTEANVRLMALDASKSEFVSVAAHQLRTPITGIRWSFNALLDRELGEVNSDQQKLLEDGLKSSIRMIDLINDLLSVARIEEGRFGLRFKKQPFGIMIQGVVDRHKKSIDEKGILFFLDIQPGLPSLEIDEEKMNIALDNIFDNAIKYTSPGGTITITAKEENKYAHISISDTGIGIPKDQINKLFVKFFRADNALRFQTSGSGLGLYVVKNIVEAHGGTISITSEEGKGTTFTFTIPVPDK